MTNDPVLAVEDLKMHYSTQAGVVRAVDGVSFSVERGQSLGLVGESGCGKSSIAMTLLKLLPRQRKARFGQHLIERRRSRAAQRRRDEDPPMGPHIDGVPSRDELPRSRLSRRRPDRRGVGGALRRRQVGTRWSECVNCSTW